MRLPLTTLTAKPTASVLVAFSVTVPVAPERRGPGRPRPPPRKRAGRADRTTVSRRIIGACKRMAAANDSLPPCAEFYAVRSDPAISAAISATSVGVRPTRTPLASSASCLAIAVPAVPETIAPAWPIVLPGGAVKPAM